MGQSEAATFEINGSVSLSISFSSAFGPPFPPV